MVGIRQFTYSEVSAIHAKDERFRKLDLMHSLEILFETSAVGNVRRNERDEEFRYSFRYRNPDVPFNPNDDITVHRGLVKALNLN